MIGDLLSVLSVVDRKRQRRHRSGVCVRESVLAEGRVKSTEHRDMSSSSLSSSSSSCFASYHGRGAQAKKPAGSHLFSLGSSSRSRSGIRARGPRDSLRKGSLAWCTKHLRSAEGEPHEHGRRRAEQEEQEEQEGKENDVRKEREGDQSWLWRGVSALGSWLDRLEGSPDLSPASHEAPPGDPVEPPEKMKGITLAGGCFWCLYVLVFPSFLP